MLSTVFFDLDGTLLPMDQEHFVQYYLGLLVKKMVPYGYAPDKLVRSIWAGTEAMYKNDGSVRNYDVFWNTFSSLMGEETLKDIPVFDEFYQNDFQRAQVSCGFNPQAAEVIKAIHGMDLKTVLATNPLFPAVATQSRVRWAGLDPADFIWITTYENSRHSKPNLAYYQDILDELGLAASECIMVGNDVSEDMPAAKTGMKVFLLTDCLINKYNADISLFPNGSFQELLQYIESLC